MTPLPLVTRENEFSWASGEDGLPHFRSVAEQGEPALLPPDEIELLRTYGSGV